MGYTELEQKECKCKSVNFCQETHWHTIDCPKCKDKGWFRKFFNSCNDCAGTGRLETCCCGGGVRREAHAGCAIATATLGTYSVNELELLKIYRREVLEKGFFGMMLSEYYDAVKINAANLLKNKTLLKIAFLYVFVKPGVWLVKQRVYRKRKFCGVLAYLVVVFMLCFTTPLHCYSKILKK